MENEHDVTFWRGRDLKDKLCYLALMCEEENIKTQNFYVKQKDGVVEVFRVKYNADTKRVFVKFADGERPSWKKMKSSLRDLRGQYKAFMRRTMGSHRKHTFRTNHFKACIMLLLEVAQSVITTSSIESRNETELAIQAVLHEESCNADVDDFVSFLASSREENDNTRNKTRRKAFERLMLRKTSRQMRAVLKQGYFTDNSKKQLRETISTYRKTPNVYLNDAVKTLSKILYKDEFFDLRNKEAFKIILSVLDTIAVFDSISE